MRKIKVVDSSFSHNNTINLVAENLGQPLKYFQWDFHPGSSKIKFFTENELRKVKKDKARKKIALMIEPYPLIMKGYLELFKLRKKFDVILTHRLSVNKELRFLGSDARYYPFGGSWIKDWSIFPKTKMISILTSHKTMIKGHFLRHTIIHQHKQGKIDIYGEPYTPYLPNKVVVLRPYRYSIIIENTIENGYFSEKLIDCLSQGTIPIYWGGNIKPYFDMDGILPFSTLEELDAILSQVNDTDYSNRLQAISNNLKLAEQYKCCENWIFEHYPDLFKGVK